MLRIARRFVRSLFVGLAAGSGLTCAAAMILWIRGYFVGDSFKYHAPPEVMGDGVVQTEYLVASSRGRLGVGRVSTSNATRLRTQALTWGRDRPPVPMSVQTATTPWGRLGFQFIYQVFPLGGDSITIVIGLIAPSWSVVAVTAIPPGVAHLAWRRRRRAKVRMARGQCVRCGYDLRESPERCPECGADVEGTYSGSGLPLVSGKNSSITAPRT